MSDDQEKVGRSGKKLIIGAILIAAGLYAVIGGILGATDNKKLFLAPSGSIRVEIVESHEDRQRGLSGRDTIGDNEGMLFVFEQSSDQNCFWMKNMKFVIDMVWLNDDRQVVSVESGVAPETFPASFCPASEAKYGLEVGQGRAEALGLSEGESVRF